MTFSRERVLAEAATTGFRPEVLEKVLYLLALLGALGSHPFLRGRWALKGGTALNLFAFGLPRLSVDIDLNYVGTADRDVMLAERPKVDQAMAAVFAREGFAVNRQPAEHAGGKWRLRYAGALGGGGNLEVDLNFMLRVPLWPVVAADSHPLGTAVATGIPVLDLHELAAGKLAALLSRTASRDLFDAHQLLTTQPLDPAKLRLGFVLYGAMNRRDWRTVSVADVSFDDRELENQLTPVLSAPALAALSAAARGGHWAGRLVGECKERLAAVLPLLANEREFLDHLLDRGDVRPELLTADAGMAATVAAHPMIRWKALNVRQFKGG